MTHDLTYFFSPRGVALIGASAHPDKISYGVLRNLTECGYQGPVYPVNPHYQQINGLTCYPDIASVPDPVELAVIVLHAKLTPAVLEDCGRRGLKAAVIVSGGFKEIGPEGAAIEDECLAIARRYGLRLMGPNCIGTIDGNTGLNTTFIGMPERGDIAFISQSGGVCSGVIDYIKGRSIGFSRFISLGNEADITETDMIEFLANDPHSRVIAVYVEGISHGHRFMEVARRVSRYKPIVLLKGGRTDAGSKAVSSHTGALAGSNAAYEAAFHQCGVIEVFSIHELFDVSLALAYQPLPAGKRVFVLTNSGGPAALATDNIALQGMVVTELTPATAATLRQHFDSVVPVGNPTDMLGSAGPDEYEFALSTVLTDSNVDAVMVIVVPHVLLNTAEVAARIGRVAQTAAKPIFVCLVGDHSITEARRRLHEQRVPTYAFPEMVTRALRAMWDYTQWHQHPPTNGIPKFHVNKTIARQLLTGVNSTHALGEAGARPLLTAYHIPVIAGAIARSADEAVSIANDLSYPVALKIVSTDILHKSEAGGILLNLENAAAVRAAYEQLLRNAVMAYPSAHLDGVLVETMAPKGGYEVIIGMRRDPQFGPLIMFGLGGIYVELLTDVSFRVAPINREEALAMIYETKAGRLLSGLRGHRSADINAVADCILRLSQLALDFPQIQEVEVNPLLALPSGQGAVALDGRVILSAN